MQSIFAPAMSVMNRLKYPQKFLFIGLLALIPITILLTQYLTQINQDIEFAAKEQIGLVYNTPVFDLLIAVHDYAAYSGAALAGADEYRDRADAARAQVEAQMAAVAAVDARLGSRLSTTPLWQQIETTWGALEAARQGGTAQDLRSAHEQMAGQLLALLTVSGNNSNLILDPDIDSYYLMDTVITKLPQSADYLAQLRAYGLETAVSGADNQGRVDVLSGLAQATLNQNQTAYEYAYEFNGALRDVLSTTEDEVYHSGSELLASLLNGGSLPSTFVDRSSAVLGEASALYDQVSDLLNGLLQARIDRMAGQRNLVLAVTVAALASAVYLLVGFYLAVKKTIADLARASDIMVSGQHGAPITFANRDELAEVVLAFTKVADELVTARDRALQASRLKDDFLATMSHELRTPLNSIIGFTGILTSGMRGKVDDQAKTMLGKVRESSQNLLRLINDVLDIAKIEAGRMEIIERPTDLRALLATLQAQHDVLAKGRGLSLSVDIDPELPGEVYIDPDRLGQVLTNLLTNAIKFTEQGSVRLSARRQGTSMIFEVQDTGVGIPPNALDYIFDEFRQVDGTTQRAYGGTGLGLAIVKKLCLTMGGRTQVRSTLGQGSTFTVTLPLDAGAASREVIQRVVEYAS